VIRKLIIILSLCVLLGASAHAGNLYNVPYGSSNYGIKFNSIANCFSIVSYDADVSIKTFIGTTQQDSILLEKSVAYNLTAPCDSIYIIRTTGTSLLIVVSYHPTKCPSISDAGITSPDVETAILVESFDMNAQKYRTFPVPLYYVGKNNYVAFAISADTWPDTLWYQIVQSNTMMDTTTVMNLGTPGSIKTTSFITKESVENADSLCEYLGWSYDGIYFTGYTYTHIVADQDGYPGLAKFVGIRVGTSSSTGVSGLKVVLYLSKVGEVGVN